jgi:hypothetical protein
MMRIWGSLVLGVLLSACATMHGPRTITLSAAEIEKQIQTDLGDVLDAFKGLGARRPEVSLMPSSQRLALEWSFGAPDEPAGFASRVTAEISGKPVLAASGNGIDLTEVRLDDVRLAALPRFLGLSRLVDSKGMTLPDVPLMTLSADRLRQGDVAYAATGVSVGFTGLKIDIAPR